MNLSRRQFLVSSASVAALAALPPLEGCTKQQQLTLAQEVNVIGTTGAQIAAELGNNILATQINNATVLAVKVITNWQAGTPTDQVIEALQALQAVVALIPAAGPYEGLIAILLGAIQAALALLPQQATPSFRTRTVSMRNHRLQKVLNIKDFERQYNVEVVKFPELGLHLL